MTEESIEILEEFKTKGYSMLYIKYGDRIKTNFKIEKAIETVLNLIQKQQEEIEMYKDIKRIAETQVTELADFIDYKGKLEQKDKIIDLMARAFKQDDTRSVEEIKEYFKKKAEETV